MADISLQSGARPVDRHEIRQRLAGFLSRHGAAFVLVALAAVAVLLLVAPVTAIHVHVLNNYSEGWNAYLAQAAAAGGTLYPDPLALTSNNYPPLSFYIVGQLGVLLGDDVFAGRLVALLGVLAVTGNIFLALRALRAAKIGAGFGALLFLTYTLSVFYGQVVIDDPIWLAEAFATTGLVLFLKSRARHNVVGAFIALVAIVAGLLVKHNILALPVALYAWCLFYDRKAFLTWTIGGIALAGAVIAVCSAAYGTAFFVDIFLHQRIYSARHLAVNIQLEIMPYLPLALGAIALWLLDGRHRMVRLIALYASLAAGLGLFFLGGVGVVDSVLCDLTIALALSCGLLVGRLSRDRGTWKPAWIVAAMLLLASPVAVALPLDLFRMNDSIGQATRASAAVNDDVAFIAGTPGPAACQTLAFCYWAGKPATLDFFNTNQKIAKGLLGEEKITDLIESRYFGLVELDANPPPEQMLPVATMTKLYALYHLARADGNSLFYLPN